VRTKLGGSAPWRAGAGRMRPYRFSVSGRNSTGDPARSVGGRPRLALRTPELLLDCFGPVRPTRTSSVIRHPVGGTLSPQALVFLNAGDGFPHQIQAEILLGFRCREAQPTEKPVSVDRVEARLQFGGPVRPGGVRSSIATLLPLRNGLRDLADSRAVCPVPQ